MNRTVCIAPMMGWTDRHERFFLRQISRHVPLFTEMKAPEAVLNRDRFLHYHPAEHPVVFQLGGHDPTLMAAASREIERAGFDEVNMNVGCPSELGDERRFGAHLMKEPEVVADCLAAMAEAVSIPVSIKTRIGVDDQDSYEELVRFVEIVRRSGCRLFTIHARKAWLNGLSCRANRSVPPLRYEVVYRLKRDFPDLTIILNGGVECWQEARRHLEVVDGVMVGRRAYRDPYWLATVDRDFYGSQEAQPSMVEVLRRCVPYVEAELAAGTPMRSMARHLVGLMLHNRGSRRWRYEVGRLESERGAGLGRFLDLIGVLEELSPAMANCR